MNIVSLGNRELQVWIVSKSSPGVDAYLARVQTLALWYIEGAQYTDNNDPRWQHYFLLVFVVSHRMFLLDYFICF